MRKKGVLMGLLLLLLCGCNGKERIEEIPTKQPTVAAPTQQPTVVNEEPAISTKAPTQPANMSENTEGIPIEEDYFGDPRFCDILKQYDLDQNGYFSEKEIAQITSLDLTDPRAPQEGYTEIKGLTYFTSLEILWLESAEQIEIRDVPKLSLLYVEPQRFDYDKKQIFDLQIVNCPQLWGIYLNNVNVHSLQIVDCHWLQEITLEDVVLGEEESQSGVFLVENSRNLCYMSMTDVEAYVSEAKILGTPYLELSIGKNVQFSNELCLDSQASIGDESCKSWGVWDNFEDITYNIERGENAEIKDVKLKWETSEEHVSFTEASDVVMNAAEKLRERFCVRVEEAVPTVTDADGRKAYNILVNNELLNRFWYEVWPSKFRKADEFEMLAVIYSDTVPEPAQFSLVWEKPVAESLSVTSYSPVWGISFEEETAAEVRMQHGNREEVLATVEFRWYGWVNKEGELTAENIESGESEFSVITGLTEEEEKKAAEYKPEAGELPIDKEFFGGLMFREYLKDYVDENRNGYLSEQEREAITSLGLEELDMGEDGLSGFFLFPNLEVLYVPECRSVQCTDCPKLEKIITPSEETDFLEIENCPALEKVGTGAEVWGS